MDKLLDVTYVINMDADVDRLKDFNLMMDKLNWNFIRFPAVNGRNLLDSEIILKQKYVHKLTWMKPSEIGCMLSHVSLWKQVAENPEYNRIAIFEDDARTHVEGDKLINLLSEFYSYLEDNNIPEPNMLYLGKSLDDCMNYENVMGNIYKSTHPQCLHAYIITKEGANKLLQMAPFKEAIDMIPIKAIEKEIINVMAAHPSIFFQDIFGTISNLRNLASAINNTTECRVAQQYIGGDTWEYIIIILIGLFAVLILFIIFLIRS